MKKNIPDIKGNGDVIKFKKEKETSSTNKPSRVSKESSGKSLSETKKASYKVSIGELMKEGVASYTGKRMPVGYERASKVVSKFAIIDELNSEKKSDIIIEELIGNTGLSLKIIAESIFEISLKTLHNYRKSQKTLPTKIYEQSIKVEELFNKGKEIFGSEENFRTWMNTPSFGLNNKVPLVLLNSVTGIDLVYEELIRIEFGTPV